MADLVDRNPILVTALNPVTGYETGGLDRQTGLCRRATVKEVAADMTKLTPGELNRLLNPRATTERGIL
jgi:fumarate hydratase class II